jgi:hypothetical protein
MPSERSCTPCVVGLHELCVKKFAQNGPYDPRLQTCACTDSAPHDLPAGVPWPVAEPLVSHINTMRTFPVPKRLAHLPVDKRGFPIPYVAEDSAPSPEGKMDIEVLDLRPWGGPKEVPSMNKLNKKPSGYRPLGKLNPGRQRYCGMFRKCGVCGRQINATEPVVLIGGAELVHTGFREPFTHMVCAVFSLYACPGISRSDVVIVEAHSFTLKPMSLRFVEFSGLTGEQRPLDPPVALDGQWPGPRHGELLSDLLIVPGPDSDISFNPALWRATHLSLLIPDLVTVDMLEDVRK